VAQGAVAYCPVACLARLRTRSACLSGQQGSELEPKTFRIQKQRSWSFDRKNTMSGSPAVCQVALSKYKNVTVAFCNNFRALIRYSINTPRRSLTPKIFCFFLQRKLQRVRLRSNPWYWKFVTKPHSHFGMSRL